MDISSVLNSLQNSYQGNSQQVLEAQNYLTSCKDNPADFSSILIQILLDQSIPEAIKFAASIQLKYILSDQTILQQMSFDFLINLIIQVPPLAQIQLQKVLSDYSNMALLKDPAFIQTLMSFLSACFQDDQFPKYIGFQIIRNILKSHIQGLDKQELVNKFFLPLIGNSPNIQFDDVYLIHHFLLTLNLLLNYSDLEPLDTWATLIISILSQDVAFSIRNPSMPFKIDKDCVKFATGIIEMKPRSFNPQLAAQIFMIIVDKIQKNQMSYEAILYSLDRYVLQFLNYDEFLNQFAQTNFIFEFVTKILYNFFVLTPNLIQQSNEDLFSFLFSRHNSSQTNDTPISCAISIMKELFKKGYLLNEIAQFSLQLINNSIHENLFSSVHFSSILAPFLDQTFSELVLNLIQMKISQDNSSIFNAASLFLFSSHVSVQSNDLFLLCLSNLAKNELPHMIQYFSAVSLPMFYSIFQNSDEIVSKILESIDISVLFAKLLELNSTFPTSQMSITTQKSFNYFIEWMEPISINMSESLFSIFFQLLSSDDQNPDEISSSLAQLCELMKDKKSSVIPFFTHFWQMTVQLLSTVDANYYDKVLSLFNASLSSYFSTFSDESINQDLLSLLVDVPNILNQLYQQNKELSIFSTIVEIITVISINLHQYINTLNVLSTPMAEILLSALSPFASEEGDDDEYQSNSLISLINKLTDVIFLVLNDENSFPGFLEIFTNINQPYFADSLAALAVMNPVITFSNDLNFKIVVNSASPAVFLLCMQKVIGNFDEMPENVGSSLELLQQEIFRRRDELLEIISLMQNTDAEEDTNPLNLMELDDIEDTRIFNFEELYMFWKDYQ